MPLELVGTTDDLKAGKIALPVNSIPPAPESQGGAEVVGEVGKDGKPVFYDKSPLSGAAEAVTKAVRAVTPPLVPDATKALVFPAEKIIQMEQSGPALREQAIKNIGEFVGKEPPPMLSEAGRSAFQTAKVIGGGAAATALEMAPTTPTSALEFELFGAATKGLSDAVRAGSTLEGLVGKYFPKTAEVLFKERPALSPEAMGNINYYLSEFKRMIGIPQERGLSAFNVRQAMEDGKISEAMAARYDDAIKSELIKRNSQGMTDERIARAPEVPIAPEPAAPPVTPESASQVAPVPERIAPVAEPQAKRSFTIENQKYVEESPGVVWQPGAGMATAWFRTANGKYPKNDWYYYGPEKPTPVPPGELRTELEKLRAPDREVSLTPTSQKEPWQMTALEFTQSKVPQATKASPGMIAQHKVEVAGALRDGQPVPPEVLAEYPDLQVKTQGESFQLDQPEPVRTGPIKPAQEQYIMPGTPEAKVPPVSTGTNADQIDNNVLLDDLKQDNNPSLDFNAAQPQAVPAPKKMPWDQSFDEFKSSSKVEKSGDQTFVTTSDGTRFRVPEGTTDEQIHAARQMMVSKALDAGVGVPYKTVKDYPQLLQKQDDIRAQRTKEMEINAQNKAQGIGAARFLKSIGKINPNLPESSDILEIGRKDLIDRKKGKSLDHAAELFIEAGYLPEGSTGRDVIDLLDKEIKTGKKAEPIGEETIPEQPIDTYSDDSLDRKIAEHEDMLARGKLKKVGQQKMAELIAERKRRLEYQKTLSDAEFEAFSRGIDEVRNGLEDEGNAQYAREVLKNNGIDDRVIVKVVDEIERDDSAFKSGYGREFDATAERISGVTRTVRGSGGRLEAVIELARGSSKGTARHEAFHAVTNLLLNSGEQAIILRKYGNWEKAADAFGQYEKTGKSGSSIIDRLFAAIKRFLERLKNWMKDREFKTADDVFEAIDRGGLAGRGERGRGMTEYATERDITKTDAFKKWFGKSKVVDAEGKPLVVYHGTSENGLKGNFFDKTLLGYITKSRSANAGFYFVDKKDIAEGYSRLANDKPVENLIQESRKAELEKKWELSDQLMRKAEKLELDRKKNPPRVVVVEAYLSIKKPYEFDAQEQRFLDIQDEIHTAIEKAKNGNYDGIVFRNLVDVAEWGKNDVADHWVVFEPTQIKSATGNRGTFDPKDPRIQYATEKNAPTFYSGLQRIVEEKMPNAAPVAQVRSILANAKKEEVDWSGVNEWLNGKDNKVWSGAFDTRDGKIIETHTKEEAENSDYHHSLYFSPETIDGMRSGDYQFFFINKNGKVETEWREKGAKPEIIKKIEGELLSSRRVSKAELLDFLKQNEVQVKEVVKGGPAADAEFAGWGTEEIRQHLIDNMNADPEDLKGMGRTELLAWARENADFNDVADHPGAPKFSQYQTPGGENYRELLLTMPIEKNDVSKMRDKHQAYADRMDRGEILSDAEQKDYETNLQSLSRHPNPHLETGSASGGKNVFRSSHFDEPNILAHVRFNGRTDAEGKRVLFIEEVQSDWHQKGREEGYANRNSDAALPLENIQLKPDGKFRVWIDGSRGWTDAVVDTREDAIQWLKDRVGGEDYQQKGVPDAPFKKTWHELAMKRMIRYAAENGFDKIAWTTGEMQAERYDLSKQVEAVWAEKLTDGTKAGQYEVNFTDKNGKETRAGVFPEADLPDVVGKDLAEKIVSEAATYPDGHKYSGLDLKVGGEGMKGFYDQMIPSFLNKYAKKWGGKVGETEIQTGGESGQFQVILPNGKVVATESTLRLAENTAKNFEGATVKAATDKVHSLDVTPSMKRDVLQLGQPQFATEPVPPNVSTSPEAPKKNFEDLNRAIEEKEGTRYHLGEGESISTADLLDGVNWMDMTKENVKTTAQQIREFIHLFELPQIYLNSYPDSKPIAEGVIDTFVKLQHDEFLLEGYVRAAKKAQNPKVLAEMLAEADRDNSVNIFSEINKAVRQGKLTKADKEAFEGGIYYLQKYLKDRLTEEIMQSRLGVRVRSMGKRYEARWKLADGKMKEGVLTPGQLEAKSKRGVAVEILGEKEQVLVKRMDANTGEYTEKKVLVNDYQEAINLLRQEEKALIQQILPYRNYIPHHRRTGKFWVNAVDEQGQTVYAARVPNKAIADRMEMELKRRNPDWVTSVKPHNDSMNVMPSFGSMVDVQFFLNKAGIEPNSEAGQRVMNAYRSMSPLLSGLIHSKNIPGYAVDYTSIVEGLERMARSAARRNYRVGVRDLQDLTRGIMNSFRRNTAMKYVNALTQVQEYHPAMQAVKTLTYYYLLANKVTYAVQNLTEPIFAAGRALSVTSNPVRFVAPLSSEFTRLTERAKKEGILKPFFQEQVIGEKLADRIGRLDILGRASETKSSEKVFEIGLRLARDKGLYGDEAYRFAYQFLYNSGKPFYMGANKPIAVLGPEYGAIRKYSFDLLNFSWDFANKFARGNMRAKLLTVLAWALLAGVESLPYGRDALKKIGFKFKNNSKDYDIVDRFILGGVVGALGISSGFLVPNLLLKGKRYTGQWVGQEMVGFLRSLSILASQVAPAKKAYGKYGLMGLAGYLPLAGAQYPLRAAARMSAGGFKDDRRVIFRPESYLEKAIAYSGMTNFEVNQYYRNKEDRKNAIAARKRR